MRGRASIKAEAAHSCRIVSVSLLIGSGLATVLVEGNVFSSLLKP
jgi:hypothetical protein